MSRYARSDIEEAPFRTGKHEAAAVAFIGDAAHPMSPNLGQVTFDISTYLL